MWKDPKWMLPTYIAYKYENCTGANEVMHQLIKNNLEGRIGISTKVELEKCDWIVTCNAVHNDNRIWKYAASIT